MMKTQMLDLIAEDYQNVLNDKVSLLSSLKNSLVVITGGTGFVGTWLTGMLTHLNDHYNFNIDILLVARNESKRLAERKDVKFFRTDVRYVGELPTETEWIIHCAATPDNRFHASQPLETMSIIAQGAHAILRAAERCSRLRMMLNISSGLVYGAQPSNIEFLPENYVGAPKCSTVSSAYAEAKRYAETLCSAARSQARTPIVTARPFAFIGPYQSLEAPWAINNFIHDALRGNTIRVLGDGNTVRSYLYASDMAFWLLRILTQGNSGEIYNVGSPEAISLRNLAEMIAQQIKLKPDIQLQTSSATHIPVSRFVPDISKIKNKLKLEVTVSLHEAVKRTIIWNQQNGD